MHIIDLLIIFQNTLNVLFHFAFVTIKGTHFPSVFSASFWLCLPTVVHWLTDEPTPHLQHAWDLPVM